MIKIGILGGGVAGLSLAHFLSDQFHITLLEKNKEFGGLARSYKKKGIYYDIGPHIIFSKNKKTLDFMTSLCPMNQLKRSNKIFYQNKLITYPFENFLGQIENEQEISQLIKSFVNNPYESYSPSNMHAFFLKTFGEGITNSYLRPYNEKIWKFDPVFMNTKMVNRIPKPPIEDIINGSKGNYSDGYTHQLYFYYPKSGGIQSLVEGLINKVKTKKNILLNSNNSIKKILKKSEKWEVYTSEQIHEFDFIINTLPIHELNNILSTSCENINSLKYNSIYIILINVKNDAAGENFSIMVPQKDIIFHRVSKLNFLGENYIRQDHSTTFMTEVTFREGDSISQADHNTIIKKCISGLIKMKFIKKQSDVNFTDIKKEKYAYVIYDLEHEHNMNIAKNYFKFLDIDLCGRFGEFEYYNMDKVIENAHHLAQKYDRKLLQKSKITTL